MHDPGGVRRCERIGHLRDDAGDLDHRQLPAGEASLERFSVVVRHRDERLTGVVANLVDRRDVWMIERAGGTRLAEQPGRAVATSGRFPLQKLERHAPVEVGVLSQIHRAHPAGADAADDPVMGDGGADHCVTILLLEPPRRVSCPACPPCPQLIWRVDGPDVCGRDSTYPSRASRQASSVAPPGRRNTAGDRTRPP